MAGGVTRFPSALGAITIAWSELGVTSVRLPAPHEPEPLSAAVPRPPVVATAIAALQALLSGEPRDLRAIPLDETGLEPTRRRIYAAAREIPFGTTVTYGELGRRCGVTNARFVGRAMATNPFPLIVPCHRVVGADGRLVGFSGGAGLATKLQLLGIEGAAGYDAPLLRTATKPP